MGGNASVDGLNLAKGRYLFVLAWWYKLSDTGEHIRSSRHARPSALQELGTSGSEVAPK